MPKLCRSIGRGVQPMPNKEEKRKFCNLFYKSHGAPRKKICLRMTKDANDIGLPKDTVMRGRNKPPKPGDFIVVSVDAYAPQSYMGTYVSHDDKEVTITCNGK